MGGAPTPNGTIGFDPHPFVPLTKAKLGFHLIICLSHREKQICAVVIGAQASQRGKQT